MNEVQESQVPEDQPKEGKSEDGAVLGQAGNTPEETKPMAINNDYPDQDIKHGEIEPELNPDAPALSDKVAPNVTEYDIRSGAVANDLPLVQPGEVPHLYQQYEPKDVADPKELSMPVSAYGVNGPIVNDYAPKMPENATDTVVEPENPEDKNIDNLHK